MDKRGNVWNIRSSSERCRYRSPNGHCTVSLDPYAECEFKGCIVALEWLTMEIDIIDFIGGFGTCLLFVMVYICGGMWLTMHNARYEQWCTEGLQMIEDAPDLQIKHTILLIDEILHIKILQKRGYSWVDIGQDYNLDVDSKCITNRGELIIFKWG